MPPDPAGMQIPKATWERARQYYRMNQNPDGSWDPPGKLDPALVSLFGGKPSKTAATCAAAIALYIVNDILNADLDGPVPPDPAYVNARRWIAANLQDDYTPFEWYLIGRLGEVTKQWQFGGRDLHQLGGKQMFAFLNADKPHGVSDLAFAVSFLAERSDPIVMAKLEHAGGGGVFWNDVGNITEFVSNRFELRRNWRLVTPDTPLEVLREIPILHIGGARALAFDEAMKRKLKAYIDGGGTILATNYAEDDAFDKSLRALVAELWPEGKLEALPATHRVFAVPRQLKEPLPPVEGMPLPAQDDRLAVIYLPGREVSRELHLGKRPALDLSANLTMYALWFRGRFQREHAETK